MTLSDALWDTILILLGSSLTSKFSVYLSITRLSKLGLCGHLKRNDKKIETEHGNYRQVEF